MTSESVLCTEKSGQFYAALRYRPPATRSNKTGRGANLE